MGSVRGSVRGLVLFGEGFSEGLSVFFGEGFSVVR